MQRANSFEKTLIVGKMESNWNQAGRREEKGMTEDEMFGWYHLLHGHEFEQALVVGDREAWHAAVHGVAKSQV